MSDYTTHTDADVIGEEHWATKDKIRLFMWENPAR